MHGDESLIALHEQNCLFSGKNHTCVYTAASFAPNVDLLQSQDVTINGLQIYDHLKQPVDTFVEGKGSFVTEERSGNELVLKVRECPRFQVHQPQIVLAPFLAHILSRYSTANKVSSYVDTLVLAEQYFNMPGSPSSIHLVKVK